jgi:hypothetical protein
MLSVTLHTDWAGGASVAMDRRVVNRPTEVSKLQKYLPKSSILKMATARDA